GADRPADLRRHDRALVRLPAGLPSAARAGGAGHRSGHGCPAGGGAARAVPAGAGASPRSTGRRAGAATNGGAGMDFALTAAQGELGERAAAYVDEVLIPLEVTAELAGGRLSEDDRGRVRGEARTRGLDGGNHPTELGGRGWTNLEQVIVHEELGRNTNAIW